MYFTVGYFCHNLLKQRKKDSSNIEGVRHTSGGLINVNVIFWFDVLC